MRQKIDLEKNYENAKKEMTRLYEAGCVSRSEHKKSLERLKENYKKKAPLREMDANGVLYREV